MSEWERIARRVLVKRKELWEKLQVSNTVTVEQNELLDLAWGLIANAGGGDWDNESDECKQAAERWRDRYNGFQVSLSDGSQEEV